MVSQVQNHYFMLTLAVTYNSKHIYFFLFLVHLDPAKFGSNRPSGFGEEAWNVKSLQTTDNGRQVMAIVHLDQGPGELKMTDYRLHLIIWKNVIDYNWLWLQITPCLIVISSNKCYNGITLPGKNVQRYLQLISASPGLITYVSDLPF
jgi:hypothetical protein